jgi:hypothetical protein
MDDRGLACQDSWIDIFASLYRTLRDHCTS